jgi:formylglycine-generating enzyme required for sulfatase activity
MPAFEHSLRLESDREALTLEWIERPAWAAEIGRDRNGLWSRFEVHDVSQRMRWIPPGRFLMGSPRQEPGRVEDEGPQHVVTISHGFWLFETACTQALWEAVMSDNPSRFKSATRPVESVSWKDCVTFMDRLNEQVPGLGLSLPTEAEWEYACRAGTETATYAGALVIKGERNAPMLDEIAWYGGNSGVDFELDDGHDSSNWPEKQYPHKKAGTHPVGLKRANAWGLYDMLGNVWEWCADRYGGYSNEEVVDPAGPLQGDAHIIRGGSWVVNARGVRSAYRDSSSPDFRNCDLGFRCARVQAGAEPWRAAPSRQAERRGKRSLKEQK